jgi:hypothetical protein
MSIRRLGAISLVAAWLTCGAPLTLSAQTAGTDNVKQLAGKWEGRGSRGGGVTVWNIAEDGSVTGISAANTPFTAKVSLVDGKILWESDGAGGGATGTFTLSQDSTGKKKTLLGDGRLKRGGQLFNFEISKSE